jgi:hypothetical protein
MKQNGLHPAEARALARQMADGADGSAAQGRMWKRFIRDLSDAANAENQERLHLWSATEPEKRRFLPAGPGPIGRSFYELGEAMRADGWMTGEESSGHAVDDWFAKYWPAKSRHGRCLMRTLSH